MNIDAFLPVTYAQVEQITEEAMELIQRFCRGTLSYTILNQDNHQMTLEDV